MRAGVGAERCAKFERCYNAHYQAIAGYVARRVAPDEVDDVIAQVFLAAWRRFEEVPGPPHDRLWLFGVARNAVADHHRSLRRRIRLGDRLASDAATAPGPTAAVDPRCEPVLAAMNALHPAAREALRLVLWDELTHSEAADMLGCSVNAFELRYRRARNSVRDALISADSRSDSDARRVTGLHSSTRAAGGAS